MSGLYKGYVETKGKASIEKLKNRTTWKTYDEVKNLNGFGGVLADDTILIDIDDSDQSEILMNIVEELQLDCKVLCTSRGKHFLFKNHTIARNRTHVQLAVGLTADIKVGSKLSYEVIKIDGEERFCEWDIEEGGKYQEVPKWLFPVKATADFVDMDAGDGRNQALFNYILTLTANDFTVEETRECIRILNKFVLKQPLSDDELEVILRDDAFQKPVFFLGSTFLFDKFANYMINNHHIVKIKGRLHSYMKSGQNLLTGQLQPLWLYHPLKFRLHIPGKCWKTQSLEWLTQRKKSEIRLQNYKCSNGICKKKFNRCMVCHIHKCFIRYLLNGSPMM